MLREAYRPGFALRRLPSSVAAVFFVLGVLAAPGLVRASEVGSTQTEPAQGLSPLRVAVFPYAAPNLVQAHFERLGVYLEAELARPIELIAPPTMEIFITQGMGGEYDLVFAHTNVGAVLTEYHAYEPLAAWGIPAPDISLYVRKEGPIESVEMLRGGRVCTPSPITFEAIMGVEILRAAGLEPGRDIEIEEHTRAESALIDLLSGRADAAAASPSVVEILTDSLESGLRKIASRSTGQRVEMIARSSLPAAEKARIRQVLLAFRDRPGGYANDSFLVWVFVPIDQDPVRRKSLSEKTLVGLKKLGMIDAPE